MTLDDLAGETNGFVVHRWIEKDRTLAMGQPFTGVIPFAMFQRIFRQAEQASVEPVKAGAIGPAFEEVTDRAGRLKRISNQRKARRQANGSVANHRSEEHT